MDDTQLDDGAVRERLARIDELLDRVESVPGPTAEAALEVVQSLTEVYGEALARVLAAAPPAMADELAGDELLSHLMVLHDLHPHAVEQRVRRALDDLRPALAENGGDVQLVGVDEGVARIRLSPGGCQSCSSSDPELEQVVIDSVLALAPELNAVEPVEDSGGDRAETVIPVESLLRRPAGVGPA